MLNRQDFHDMKNDLAIAKGMLEVNIAKMERNDPNTTPEKLIERQKKALAAMSKIEEILKRGHEDLRRSES